MDGRYTEAYAQQYSFTTTYCITPSHLFLPWCLLFVTWYKPPYQLLAQTKIYPVVHLCISSFIFFYHFINLSCTSTTFFTISFNLLAEVSQPSLLAWPLPQLSTLISSPWGSGQSCQQICNPPPSLSSSSALSTPSLNHSAQFKHANRFLGLAQCVCVSVCVCLRHTPPLSTGGLRGTVAK